MKEQKQKEAQNSLIVIYGYVNLARRSILDEYIVELQVQRDWSIMNVSVVFPKRISSAMINELMQIKKGIILNLSHLQEQLVHMSMYQYGTQMEHIVQSRN